MGNVKVLNAISISGRWEQWPLMEIVKLVFIKLLYLN
jgi:hypothetical protein